MYSRAPRRIRISVALITSLTRPRYYTSSTTTCKLPKMQGILLSAFTLLLTVKLALQCPVHSDAPDALIPDQSSTISIEQVKKTLQEKGIFDWQREDLTDFQRKELNRLFDAVEIMLTSRARQPSSVQNTFMSLRVLKKALEKLFKEGQLSKELYDKFCWDKFHVEDANSGQIVV